MAVLTPDQAKAQATAQYQPTYNLGLQGLDQNALDINQNYDTLGKTLQDQANKSNLSLQERQNQLGLLQSGLTASGLGDIQKNLNTSTTQNEQQRASRLANIALQRAGLTTKYNQDIQSAVDQLLQPPKTTKLDLGNKIAMIDEQGNVVKEFTKGTAPKSPPTRPPKLPTYTPPKYKQTTNSVGGLSFVDDKNKAITAAQYLASKNPEGNYNLTGPGSIAELLSKSSDPTDQQIVQEINAGMSVDDLAAKYPYVFGGA